jgi:hypothetical protein
MHVYPPLTIEITLLDIFTIAEIGKYYRKKKRFVEIIGFGKKYNKESG